MEVREQMGRRMKKGIFFAVLLCVSAGIMVGVAWKVQGMMRGHVYVIAFRQEDQSFTELDLSNLEKEGVQVSFAKSLYPEVSNGVCKKEVSVTATNENYGYFADMQLEKGAFFNVRQTERGIKAAVVNRSAAYLLFGNDNCIGEAVYLNQIPYRVIGLAGGKYRDEARLYIPYATAGNLGISDTGVGQIWCTFQNPADMVYAMGRRGYAAEALDILQMDFNRFRKKIRK